MRRQSIIGVDVSDSSIKVLQLDAQGNSIASGSGGLASGVVVDGLIVNKELFATTLIDILKNTKPEALYGEEILLRAVLCLPESKLFTHDIVLPVGIKKTDISRYVFEDAQKIIPFDLNEMYWDFRLMQSGKQQHATFIGSPKSCLDSYVEAFTFVGVKPTLVVGELLAVASALLPLGLLSKNYMIVDIGARTANIGLFTCDELATITITVEVGGDALTKQIESKLHISKEEAEQHKKKYGLLHTAEAGEISNILVNSLKDVTEAMARLNTYAQTKYGKPVEQIIFVGGSALLPGLAPYCKNLLGIETSIGNPLTHVHSNDILKSQTPAIFFTNVIGLALKGRDIKSTGINLLTQYRYGDDILPKIRLSPSDIRSFSDLKYVLFGLFSTLQTTNTLLLWHIVKNIKKHSKLFATVSVLIVAVLFLVWVLTRYTSVFSV